MVESVGISLVKWLKHNWNKTITVTDYVPPLVMRCYCKWYRFLWILLIGGCVPPKVMLGVSTAAITSDCITTITTPGIERNPLLGPHPSTGKVIAYCGLAIGANAAGPNLVHASSNLKRIWWTAISIIEFRMAIHNLTQ